ncbi:hypothetical protein MMC17_007648 [Xylographa soralifera]|nr:hypothetical protein [Xylographa soralifera]
MSLFTKYPNPGTFTPFSTPPTTFTTPAIPSSMLRSKGHSRRTSRRTDRRRESPVRGRENAGSIMMMVVVMMMMERRHVHTRRHIHTMGRTAVLIGEVVRGVRVEERSGSGIVHMGSVGAVRMRHGWEGEEGEEGGDADADGESGAGNGGHGGGGWEACWAGSWELGGCEAVRL